jgi:putative nucleotidyltransferase with HDIG domain
MENLDVLFLISKLLNKNRSVLMHGRRVARLACAIAREIKYRAAGIEDVCLAAITHDIGKLHLPKEIINKPGALDEEESVVIREHTRIGHILLHIIKSSPLTAEVALQHHERLDGSGYPFGLRARQINPLAKIISVADVVDTMISPQVYKPAMAVEDVLSEIRQNSGLLYDPEVVSAALIIVKRQGSGIYP